jgi:hypothetical protein
MDCALCQKHPRDEVSHFIPAFVYRYVKETSATGYMRAAAVPNLRIQDGLKYPLCCRQCEDRFEKFEDAFARTVFQPFVADRSAGIRYGKECLQFCISLLWRALHHQWKVDDSELQAELRGRLDAPYARWQKFLLGEADSVGEYCVNVIPMDNLTSSPTSVPEGICQYITGSIDMDLISNLDSGHVYVKLPYFFIFGRIFENRRGRFSNNTLIHTNKGVLGGKRMRIERSISNYIESRAQYISRQSDELSLNQRQNIKKTIERDPERLLKSRTAASVLADLRLSEGRAT